MQSNETSGLLASGGTLGVLALLVGLGILVAGIVVARRGGSRGQALAVLAAALLPFLLGSLGTALGSIGGFDEIVRLGPAVTPKDMAAGQRHALAAAACGTVGTILAVCGGIAALARSRPA